jgi:nitrate reductase cytochrome c-type subunit
VVFIAILLMYVTFSANTMERKMEHKIEKEEKLIEREAKELENEERRLEEEKKYPNYLNGKNNYNL